MVGLAIVIGALMMRRRRRREDEVYEDYQPKVVERPVEQTIAAPAFADRAPLCRPADHAGRHSRSQFLPRRWRKRSRRPSGRRHPDGRGRGSSEPAAEDVQAILDSSEPQAGRPWIEFLMRPLRAGTNADDAVVEFELTVGNSGSISAKDVKVSTWMFAAGSPEESDMERMLIDPPAEARISEGTIEPGEGQRVEASITIPKAAFDKPMLPVVVADARYRLPDGSEGRTYASFEVGMPGEAGEALAPFPTDRSSGLLEMVEARLHGDLRRT